MRSHQLNYDPKAVIGQRLRCKACGAQFVVEGDASSEPPSMSNEKKLLLIGIPAVLLLVAGIVVAIVLGQAGRESVSNAASAHSTRQVFNTDPDFILNLPRDFKECVSKNPPPNMLYFWAQYDGHDHKTNVYVEIDKVQELPQTPFEKPVNVERMYTEKWQGWDISVYVIRTKTKNENNVEQVMVTRNAAVPLKGSALKLQVTGPEAFDAQMNALLNDLLAGLQGQTNWGTPADRDLPGIPPRLTGDQIRDAITAVPEGLTPDARQAVSELQTARQFFQNHFLPGQLYLCIMHYKFYLAYHGGGGFELVDDQDWRIALNGDGKGEPGLVNSVCGMYDRACEDELAQRWADAWPLFEKLVKMIPAETDDPTYDKLLKNIIEHRKFVQDKMTRKK
jgi:hypothetical protein